MHVDMHVDIPCANIHFFKSRLGNLQGRKLSRIGRKCMLRGDLS